MGLAAFLAELEPGYLRLYASALWGEKDFWSSVSRDVERELRARGLSGHKPLVSRDKAWTLKTLRGQARLWRRWLPASAGVRLLRAELRRREGRWDDGSRELRAALRLRPGWPRAFALRAKLRLTRAVAARRPAFLARSSGAKADCLRAVADPACVWVYGLLGLAHCGSGSQQAMYRRLLQAARRRPRCPELYMILAMQEFGADAAGCAEHLRRGLALRPKDLVLRAFRGELARREGRPAQALADLTRSIEGLPSYDRAYLWRSKLHRGRGDRRRALDDLAQAMRLEPLNSHAHFERYLLCLQDSRLPEALKALDEAIRLESLCPWNSPADEAVTAWGFLRFKLLCRMRDYLGAVEALRLVQARDLKYTWSHGEPEPLKSIAELDEAIALHPSRAWLHAWRGQTWLSLRDYARAAADLDRAVQLDRRPGWFQLWRAEAFLRSGQSRRCIDALKRARRRDAPEARRCGLWAEAELAASDWRSALKHARQAAKACPTAAWALISWSKALIPLGRRKEALAVLKRAHELAPGDGQITLLLASLEGHDRLFPFDIVSLDFLRLERRGRALPRRRLTAVRGALQAALQRGLRRDSKAALGRIHAMKGWAAFCGGQRQEAVEALSLALRLDPANAVYRVWRGRVHQAVKAPSKALDDFSAALSLEPRSAIAALGRSEIMASAARGAHGR